ncbi:hypothetical protein J3R83DRAFT_11358 [Lanmaoa asiatica]|nr:hypothetical protein J3R83DRAFT_11358 [Lanmaoa asiatica]
MSRLLSICHRPPPPSHTPSHLAHLGSSSLTAFTPTFLTGAILTLTGILLRAHCFYTLGPRFTFELSIRPSHTLVTQGVYGVVRHPSYTAVVAVVVGWLLCAFDPRGSVVAVCMGWVQASNGSGDGSGDGSGNVMVAGLLACAWTTVLGMWYALLSTRMNKEDAMLEKNFEEEWRAWARRVPYRLVPGVY